MAKQSIDFKEFAMKVYQNRNEHARKIKEYCVTTEVCSIDEFYKNYHELMNDMNSKVTPSKNQPSISDFKEIFCAFEEYPINIQKPKKVHSKDLNRTVTAQKTLSNSDPTESTSQNKSSQQNTLSQSNGSRAPEIYNSFRQFKQKLNKLLLELKQEDVEANYMKNLKKLNAFAKQCEKVCGMEDQDIKKAFTDEEAENLHNLVSNFEKALFIDANRNLSPNRFNQSPQNLENVIDLLTYWLDALANFQAT